MSGKKSFRIFCLLAFTVLFAGTAKVPAFQLAPQSAEAWIQILENPEHIRAQRVKEVIARLNLQPDMVVADIGAGTGVFSRPMARAVEPCGKVYAVDILPGLLAYIAQRAAQENIGNIQTVLGKFDDPTLPTHDVDLAFLNDSLHHIAHRSLYLKNLTAYVKPSGRIAIVEMNKDDPDTQHKNRPELLIGRDDMIRWMADAGFRPIQQFDGLFPGTKTFIIYGRE